MKFAGQNGESAHEEAKMSSKGGGNSGDCGGSDVDDDIQRACDENVVVGLRSS